MKRQIAFATGVIAIVFNSFAIVAALIIFGFSFLIARVARNSCWMDWHGGWSCSSWSATNGGILAALIIVALVILALAITGIVLGSKLCSRSRKVSDPRELNNLIIAILVLSIFSGGIIPLVFAVIALCAASDENNMQANIGGNSYQNPSPQQPVQQCSVKAVEFEQALARLKQYKSDGIIDDELFKQKADELFKKYYMDDNA